MRGVAVLCVGLACFVVAALPVEPQQEANVAVDPKKPVWVVGDQVRVVGLADTRYNNKIAVVTGVVDSNKFEVAIGKQKFHVSQSNMAQASATTPTTPSSTQAEFVAGNTEQVAPQMQISKSSDTEPENPPPERKSTPAAQKNDALKKHDQDRPQQQRQDQQQQQQQSDKDKSTSEKEQLQRELFRLLTSNDLTNDV